MQAEPNSAEGTYSDLFDKTELRYAVEKFISGHSKLHRKYIYSISKKHINIHTAP